jgi:flagellar hook protein FlgE
VSGLRDATLRLDVAANNVANALTEGFRPSRVSTSELPGGGVQSAIIAGDLEGVELAGEMVAVMIAEAAFTANARVLSSAFRTDRRILDLLA